MTAVSNVSSTEYTYQSQSAQGSQSSASVWTDKRAQAESTSNVPNTQEETPKLSKLDEKLNKLVEELKELKINISAEEIKAEGVLTRIAGVDDAKLETFSDEDLQKVIDSLKEAIKDSAKDGKADFNSVKNLGNQYYIAIRTGWTIEGFKKQQKNVKKSTLLERLQETNCLAKRDNYDLSDSSVQEEIRTAIRQFFDKELLSKVILNPKTDAEKAKNKKLYKAQLQTFGRILANSPEEQKVLFLDVAKNLYADNRLKGFKSLLASCEAQDTRTIIARTAATNPDYIREMTTTPTYDSEGNLVDSQVMSEDDATEFSQILYENLDETSAKEAHAINHSARKEWFEQNQDKLRTIEEKIQKAQEQGIEPNLTEEEKQLLLEKRNYIIAGSAGETIGIAGNTLIDKDGKTELLTDINKDNYELPVYREVLTHINDYLQNHEGALSEDSIKILNVSTNNNLSIIKNNPEANLRAPDEVVEPKGAQASDYGFITTSRENYERAIENAQTIQESILPEQKVEFKVTKSDSYVTSPSKSTSHTVEEVASFYNRTSVREYLASGGSMMKLASHIFTKFSQACSEAKDAAITYFAQASAADKQVLSMGITSEEAVLKIAKKGEDVSKYDFALSHDGHQIVDNFCEDEDKEKNTQLA